MKYKDKKRTIKISAKFVMAVTFLITTIISAFITLI